jgi:hypothetical protein
MVVTRHISRLAPALLASTCALTGSAVAAERPDAAPAGLKHLRAEFRRQVLKKPRVILKPGFLERAEAVGSILPFTIRLRRSYEGGPGDDVLQLAWDAASVPWPLDGTAPPAAPSTSTLDGALTYDWDFGADTSGYAGLGTTETLLGRTLSASGTGFPLAVPSGTCTGVQKLDVTGVTFSSAGLRFGTVNPFSGDVFGTINLRSRIRTAVTACDGTTAATYPLATTAPPDPPIPVAFYGKMRVSPSITADGHVRLGLLRIADAAPTPQRTTFALVHACTDPAAADHCARQAFPARVKFLSLDAEILAGDQMPAQPAGDPPDPGAMPPPSP